MKVKCIVQSVVTITLLLQSNFAVSQETYEYERMWPALSQPWYFVQPRGIAKDPSGHIYVVDTQRCVIEKFRSDGFFVTRWGNFGAGAGEFNQPQGVCVDPEGNVYVSDAYNHRIQKFNADGEFLLEWGSEGAGDGDFFIPCGIAADSYGNIYVVDVGLARIQKFNSSGTFITKWGQFGTGPGEFRDPYAIAVSLSNEDFVYVADSRNNRIQRFSTDGELISQWGGIYGSGDGEFRHPTGIAIDQEGYVYVADMYNLRVQKFSGDGQFITKWGNELGGDGLPIPGSGDGEFDFTQSTGKIGIAVGPEGHVCVGNPERIQKFDLSGNFITAWTSAGSDNNHFKEPTGIEIDAEGFIYVVDNSNHCIKKFDAQGNHQAFSDTMINLGSLGTGDGEFYHPMGIAFDSAGFIYVTDTGNNRIQKFDPGGNFVAKWGNICWLVDGYGCEDPDGDGPLELGDGQFLLPSGIAVDNDGFIYVVDNENCRVQKFDSEGTFITKWGSFGSGNGQFSSPMGIAVNADGNIYVADTLNMRVQKFNPDGDYLTEWGTDLSGDGEFTDPLGITIDAEGYIYVTEISEMHIIFTGGATEINRIQKFRDDGTNIEFITTFGSRGSYPGQLNTPHDLAVDSNGNVYVADTFNNRIHVFSPVITPSNSKAIIVAGRASAGDSLWGATQVCTNFAYRALRHQGFTKDDIYYLSADTDLNFDGDSEPNVNEFPSKTNLQSAITEWATAGDGADHLIVYLNDHGGADTFRLHEWMSAEVNGILEAGELAEWLDVFQERPGVRLSVIYEACESGSFLDELQEGHNRTIITSTLPGEKAKFLNGGTISFSNFIWTNIFNGFSLGDSFLSASQAVNFILSDQTPQLRGDAEDVYIGKSIENLVGDAPVIEDFSISELREVEDLSEVTLSAAVTDADGVTRVWAMIWPPDYVPGASTDPLLDLTLPSVELLPAGENSYEGTFAHFTGHGVYQVIMYAMDRNNNISQPQFGTISYHVTRRAIILAGDDDEPEGITQSMIETNAGLAYNALLLQGYNHDEIYFFMGPHITPIPVLNNVDDEPLLSIVGSHLGSLSSDDLENLDLVIYLIGDGDRRSFKINDSETLYPYTVNDWLTNLNPVRTTVIYDADRAESFTEELTSPAGSQLIVIASTGGESHAYFSGEGDICFSTFFWNEVTAGMTVNRAFRRAQNAISFLSRKDDISFSCYDPLSPLLDANGNGLSNEGIDYQVAESYALGLKMNYADEPPQIGYAAVEVIEGLLTIVADNITPASDQLQRVWAVIRPINYCPHGAEEEVLNFTEEVDLVEVGTTGRYEWEWNYGSPIDACKVTVYAMDTEGNTSQPKETRAYQSDKDIYEDDDTYGDATVIVVGHPTPQPHTFYLEGSEADRDWIKFYGRRGEYYTIEAGNLEEDCEPTMVLYDNTLEPIRRVEWTFNDDTVVIEYQCPEEENGEGIYYVELFNGTDGVYTGYDIKVYQPYPRQVMIAGRVIDRKTHTGIDGAYIKAGGTGAAISVGGGYELFQIPGTCTIEASAPGYTHYSDTVIVGLDDEFIAKDIRMTPISTPTTTTTTTTSVDCTSDADCDDGLYCNGEEICDQENGVCLHSGNPCLDPAVVCDEDNDRCVAPPEPSILLRPDFCFQSRWIPLLVFIRIEGENTHFNTSTTEVNFSPQGSILAIPFLLNEERIFLIGLMMPSWVAPAESVDVTVKTGTEEVPQSLTIEQLPFIFDEGKTKKTY